MSTSLLEFVVQSTQPLPDIVGPPHVLVPPTPLEPAQAYPTALYRLASGSTQKTIITGEDANRHSDDAEENDNDDDDDDDAADNDSGDDGDEKCKPTWQYRPLCAFVQAPTIRNMCFNRTVTSD